MSTTFSERLKECRLGRGMSQAQLAEIAGIQKRTQLSYEFGRRKPDSEYLQRLSAAGFDTHYLLTGHRFLLPVIPERGPGYSDEGWAIFMNGWDACFKALRLSGVNSTPTKHQEGA